MGNSTEPTALERDEGNTVSRRGFLGVSSLLLFGSRKRARHDSTSNNRAPRKFDDLVLNQGDLLAPDPATYVEQTADLADGSLVRFLRDSMVAFEAKRVTANGFVASRNHDTVPLSVESAAFEFPEAGGGGLALAEGIAMWVETTRETNDAVKRVDVVQGADVTMWKAVTHDDWLDVVHVQRVGDAVLVTVAYGDSNASVDPATAVEHYARIVRERVSGR